MKESCDVAIEVTEEAASLVTETGWHKTPQVKRLPEGRILARRTG